MESYFPPQKNQKRAVLREKGNERKTGLWREKVPFVPSFFFFTCLFFFFWEVFNCKHDIYTGAVSVVGIFLLF